MRGRSARPLLAAVAAVAALLLLPACGEDEDTTAADSELPRAGDPGTRFGFNEDFSAGDGEAALMAGAGADLARRRLSWTEIEGSPDAFDWSAYDAIYEELLDQGMRPLWVLVDAPCWSRTDDPACSPAQPAGAPSVESAADLGDFLGEVARRYPESLGIEVGNEVNDERFWLGGLNPNDYALLLGAAAEGIEAANPEMPIVVAGFAPFEDEAPGRLPWSDYLRAILNAGLAERVDAFGFHPYPPGRSTEFADAVELELAAFEEYLADRGAGEVPVWVTEIGVSTVGPVPKTDEQQSLELAAMLTRLQDRGTPVVVIHRLEDVTAAGFPLEPGFGVLAADGVTRKPAYCAIAAIRERPCP